MELKSKTKLNNGLTRHLFSNGSYVDYAADVPPAMSNSEKKQFDEMSARSWRDQELKESDWIIPLTDYPQHAAYITYRKTLRDWPSTADFPDKKPTLG
tara:strand:- start:298 stop:591 length:294 start_codon:yes stop_codon:yes gene_type:complete